MPAAICSNLVPVEAAFTAVQQRYLEPLSVIRPLNNLRPNDAILREWPGVNLGKVTPVCTHLKYVRFESVASGRRCDEGEPATVWRR